MNIKNLLHTFSAMELFLLVCIILIPSIVLARQIKRTYYQEGLISGLDKVLDDGIVQPVFDLFKGILDIFMEFFFVLWVIVENILFCSLFYAVHVIYYAISNTLWYITPWWLSYIVEKLFKYVMIPLVLLVLFVLAIFVILPIELILRIFGYSIVKFIKKFYKTFIQRCYRFNLSELFINFGDTFVNVFEDFGNNFGRFDFSKVKVKL